MYDDGFKIFSDSVFFINSIILNKSSYKKINKVISFFNLDGISLKNIDATITERCKYLKNNFEDVYDVYFEYLQLKKHTELYNGSKLIKLIAKIQKKSIYKFIRHVK